MEPVCLGLFQDVDESKRGREEDNMKVSRGLATIKRLFTTLSRFPSYIRSTMGLSLYGVQSTISAFCLFVGSFSFDIPLLRLLSPHVSQYTHLGISLSMITSVNRALERI